MGVKTITKFLIIFGVALIIIAMTMDTSVSTGYGRVQNIGLISQQQNILIIGGLAFLSGIMLFATSQKSQSSEEKIESDKNFQESVNRHVEKADQFFRAAPDKLFGHLDRWITTKRDNKLGRVGVFLFTFPFFVPLSFLLVILLGVYTFRPVRAVTVISHVLYLHIALDFVGVVMILSEGILPLSIRLTWAGILLGLAAVSYLIIRYFKRREATRAASLAS